MDEAMGDGLCRAPLGTHAVEKPCTITIHMHTGVETEHDLHASCAGMTRRYAFEGDRLLIPRRSPLTLNVHVQVDYKDRAR